MGTDNSNHVSRRDCRRRGADRPGGDCRPSARRRQEAKAQGRQEGQESPQGPKGRQEGPKEPQGRQEGQKVQEEDGQATATTCRTRRQQARPRRPNHRPVHCCRYEGYEGTHQRCCYPEGSRQEGHQGCQFCFNKVLVRLVRRRVIKAKKAAKKAGKKARKAKKSKKSKKSRKSRK